MAKSARHKKPLLDFEKGFAFIINTFQTLFLPAYEAASSQDRQL